MFSVMETELQDILHCYGITERIQETEELLRYYYEKHDPTSRDVRLILKLCFAERAPVVMKFKHEKDVDRERIQAQTAFSEHLRQNGIPTARFYRTADGFVMQHSIGGYDVLITLEDFMPGEIKLVDGPLTEKIGVLLAETHNIAERDGYHVPYPVLFDPLTRNDLFSFERFSALRPQIPAENLPVFTHICDVYHEKLEVLMPLRELERYAVQGDLSDCNLFLTQNGNIGMFDFNNCGDNVPFCDAVMQGVLVTRLMEYGRALTEEENMELLRAFFAGYQTRRPFTQQERRILPELYTVIDTFWLPRIDYADDSLTNLLKLGDYTAVSVYLKDMERRITMRQPELLGTI